MSAAGDKLECKSVRAISLPRQLHPYSSDQSTTRGYIEYTMGRLNSKSNPACQIRINRNLPGFENEA